MARKVERLNDPSVKKAKAPGYYADGNGLYLQVRGPQAKSWVFRYKRDGNARDMGLGGYPAVTLAAAREAAQEARKHLSQNKDPIKERDDARRAKKLAEAGSVTFQQFAEQWIDTNETAWKNTKHKQQWRNTLKDYAYPVFGDMPVGEVTTDLVLKVIEPIWATKTETASRVRGRIERILDSAKARGLRTGENPAVWRGHIKGILPSRNAIARTEHHAALPYADVPAFIARLRGRQGSSTARALEVTILTALRTSEAIGATFDEFDFAAKVWSVPPERVKGRTVGDAAFRVPLCDRVIAIVKELAATKVSKFVFPSRKPDKPLRDIAMLMMLWDMQPGMTVHGFRSSFRDWAAEQTSAAHDVCEYALSHMPKDKVVKAYLRADLLEKRRPLMEDWAKYCEPPAKKKPARAASAADAASVTTA